MKTTSVSTAALSEAMRRYVLDAQSALVKAQKEVASGRHADIGLDLGRETARTISFRHDYARLGAIIDTNGLVASRLDSTQSALDGIQQVAQDFLDSLAVAHDGSADPAAVRSAAEAALKSLIGSLNATSSGEYLFAGINTDSKPLSDYFSDPPSPARQAVADAFLAKFGISQSSPAAADITPADMQSFLDNEFAGFFDEPAWTSDWSQASSRNITSRISTSELIATGTNANAPAFRKLAEAFTMVADLGIGNLNDATSAAVVDAAMKTVGEAIGEITAVRASLGVAQEQVTRSSERMSVERDILNGQINARETVDPYEAATRVNALLTQIETSYALTGRIHDLTLLNYL
jgi:flagellar hook-associated protein 3 FlgL